MSRYKDLADPALVRELRRRARPADAPRDPVDRRPAAAERAPAPTAAPAKHGPRAAAPAGAMAKHAAPARSSDHPTLDEPSGFAALIGDVNPLGTPARSRSRPVPPAPHARQRNADDAHALEASRVATNPSPMAWDVGLDIESAQSFVRVGLNPDLLRKLRRGDWVVQGSLDLHRHTQEQARVALGDFLGLARRQGWRCVRIVHGKGLSSPNREPVLKAKVRKWLQLRDEVLAYCEPRPHAGGGGAVNVLLSAP